MACYGPHSKHLFHLDYLDLDRYYKKLSDYNNESIPDPFVLHDAEYIDDVSKWSEILYGNIYKYLVQAVCVYTQDGYIHKLTVKSKLHIAHV